MKNVVRIALVLVLACGALHAQEGAGAPETVEGTFRKVEGQLALVAGDKTYLVVPGEKADDTAKDLVANADSKLINKGAWTVTGVTKADANGKLWIAADTIEAKKNAGKTGGKKTGKKTGKTK
ncbi:MAG: hypothetical protein M5U26_15905 [Planctomycetota bacterium]|nr:hypothetical protein [Planctomycetota bacterium]